MIDVHAHVTDERFDMEVEEVLLRADDAGVKKIISAGTSLQTSKAAVGIAKRHGNVFATVGIHPEDVKSFERDFEEIKKLAREKEVVAIGEIGLDYHYLQGMTEDETGRNKQLQKWAFEKQIELANELNLQIVVHSRDAMGDTIAILQKIPPKKPSLLHCFSGSLESAKECMKLGFSFSFGGVVTFKNAKNVQEVVKNLPLERILLETDCPYMAPEPFRGTRNEPKNVVYVADMIARLKGISIEEVAKATTENARKLFKI